MKHFYEGNARVISSQYRIFLKQLIKNYPCASVWMEVSSPWIPSLPPSMILNQLHPLLVLIVHIHKIPLHLLLPPPWRTSGHFPGYLSARILYVFLVFTCQFYNSHLFQCPDKSEVPHFLISRIFLWLHPFTCKYFLQALIFKHL